ncbi:site-specific DNA-methyltransferase [Leptotrichia wadei]|uniref:DNA (Cytosine-5-)-methyltransferase n=1 Tax=Leptotrichia wadei TaxID=157687 RepID=A0A510KFW3_9FUSO|nr:site-specific DNA-methyltransferase [Leptotrichia wadei]BBM50578.1 DNA (cytosine-5-)-methyltransferase [Leptotrichia wadei]
MSKKLELHWIGKDKEILVEPRILIENKELSNIENDENTENMLIHGDNLLALKALEQKYTGKVKCIYIDPPYNTKSAFEHYNDNLEHSIWLSLMKSRLEILRKLLRDDGGIFVQIDDNEQAYLKVLMDEIFGRDKFLNTISVKMSEASGIKMTHASKRLPKIKEYILVYKKEDLVLNEVKIPKKTWDNEYKTIITNITKEEISFIKSVCKNEKRSENEIKKVDELLDKAKYSSLSEVYKKENIQEKDKLKFNFDNAYRIFRTTSVSEKATLQLVKLKKLKYTNVFFSQITPQNKMYIIKGDFDENKKKPRTQVIFSDDYLEYNPGDFWTDIKTTGLDNEGAGVEFKNSKKPEALISRILEMITNENDLVLDSFLGSGTTAAVAHKMNRKYIGIEMGEHAYTHCKVRLDKVISGEDKGGITKNVNWQGGGAYRFYELAPTLINEDKFGEMVINKEYSPEMLANAVALHEGYNFNPNKETFWKQSKSTENSYLLVTTKYVDINFLNSIKNDMEDEEYLVIACKNYDKVLEKKYSNIEIKKIPEMLLEKCEFNVENYNLNIINTPIYEEELGSEIDE